MFGTYDSFVNRPYAPGPLQVNALCFKEIRAMLLGTVDALNTCTDASDNILEVVFTREGTESKIACGV